jgi:uncharacterized cupin superfamily protein
MRAYAALAEEPMKVTAKFTNTEGQAIVAMFDTTNGTVEDTTGRKGTFTAVPGSKTIQITGDMSMSVQVQDPVQFTAGFTTAYTASTGKSGTVVIEKVE